MFFQVPDSKIFFITFSKYYVLVRCYVMIITLSGWYFKASFRKAFLISSWDAVDLSPSVLYNFASRTIPIPLKNKNHNYFLKYIEIITKIFLTNKKRKNQFWGGGHVKFRSIDFDWLMGLRFCRHILGTLIGFLSFKIGGDFGEHIKQKFFFNS